MKTKMNKAQFKALANSKYIKLKEDRFKAVQSCVFDKLSPSRAEVKFNLTRGVVARDVSRIKEFYELLVNVARKGTEE